MGPLAATVANVAKAFDNHDAPQIAVAHSVFKLMRLDTQQYLGWKCSTVGVKPAE
jgi:hypothetical protein